jgi:uncharacterized C2H2 Zn-finger protein
MVLQALYPTKSAVSPVEKPAGGETPTVLLGYKSMSEYESDGESGDGEQHECPTCSRNFNSARGMKIHHKQAHGQSIAKHAHGKVECPTCGDMFAQERFMSSHHKQAHGESVAGVEVKCAYCGNPTTKIPARIRACDRDFCGVRCRAAWQAQQTGADTNNWRGGFDHGYGYAWGHQREKALERDGRQCVVCGRGKEDIGREPDVHHIVRKGDFDDPETAHELDNLVMLCREHHHEWEGIPLRPQ